MKITWLKKSISLFTVFLFLFSNLNLISVSPALAASSETGLSITNAEVVIRLNNNGTDYIPDSPGVYSGKSITVHIGSTVGQLKTSIKALDNSIQVYTITTKNDVVKQNTAVLKPGDKLKVIAEDGSTQGIYKIWTTIDINTLEDWNYVSTQLTDGIEAASKNELVKVFVTSDDSQLFFRIDVANFYVGNSNLGVALSNSADGSTLDGMVWLEFNKTSGGVISLTKSTVEKIVGSSSTPTPFDNTNVIVHYPQGGSNITSIVSAVSFSLFNMASMGQVNNNAIVPLWAQTNASQQSTATSKDKVPDTGFFNFNTANANAELKGSNIAAPTVSAMGTNSSGTDIIVDFNKDISDPLGKQEFFQSNVNGEIRYFSSVSLGSSANQIVLTLEGSPIAPGNVITLDYTAGTIVSAEGGVLASLTNQPVVNNVLDSVPPDFSADYPQVSNIGVTQLDLLVKINETGKACYIVLPDGADAPSAAQIKAGTDAAGDAMAANLQGNIDVTEDTEASRTITGLTGETAYDIYVVAEDGTGNLMANGVKADVTTSAAPDETAPVFSADYPQVYNTGVTQLDLLVKTNETGKAYYIVLPDGAAVPSAAQTKAGTDAAGGAVAANLQGNIDVTEDTEASWTITGLTGETAYDIYVVAEDGTGNLMANGAKVDATTAAAPDETAPVFGPGYPQVSNIEVTQLDLLVKTNETGKAYYIVLPDGADAPSAAQIKAGTDAAGGAVAADLQGNIDVTEDAEASRTITGLTGETAYDIYVVAEDGAANLMATGAKVEVTTGVANYSGYSVSAPVTKEMTVRVEIVEGSTETVVSKATIERTTASNGAITDRISYSSTQAEETVRNVLEAGQNTARIVVPDQKDEVSQVIVDLPKETISKISAGKIKFEIFTENARIILPSESIDNITQDLYFRVVPIKDLTLRNQVAERAKTNQATLEQAKGRAVNIADRPSMIETNMPSQLVTVVLPLRESSLPSDVNERNAFLQSLYVYIEHHDGEQEIIKGSLTKYNTSGQYGIQFDINKFSTFAIIAMSSEITSYRLPGQVSPSKINPMTGTIDVLVSSGIDLSNLEAYFILSPGATATVKGVEQVSGVTTNDFTRPVEYLVKAGDGTIKNWTVNASQDNKLAIPPDGHKAYINGYPDGMFRPERGITRAEVAAIIFRLLGGNLTTITSFYSDVGSGHWANQAIEGVTHLGLMKGYPDGKFRPEAVITRAEMATVMAKWFKFAGIDESPYPDVAGHWARESIGGLKTAAIMRGYPDGTFRPDTVLLRAEAVTSINNLLGRGGLYGVTKGSWKDVPADQWAFHEIEEASKNHYFDSRPQGGEQLKS